LRVNLRDRRSRTSTRDRRRLTSTPTRRKSLDDQSQQLDDDWTAPLKVEKLERALAYQGAELSKLRGLQSGSLPGLPHVAATRAPQMLGLPGGMGRHPVGQTAGSGVRKLGTNDSTSAPDAMGAGFTRRIHPLNVIGGGGRR
jgi:hypothetical protein